MALSLISYPRHINPVYSDAEFKVRDTVNAGNPNLYYRFTFSISSTWDDAVVDTRVFEVQPDPYGYGVFNARSILESYFESTIGVHDASVSFDVAQLVNYYIVIESVCSGVTLATTDSVFYTFNGCEHQGETFDASANYFMKLVPGVQKKMLNTWGTERNIHQGDSPFLQYFDGWFYSTIAAYGYPKTETAYLRVLDHKLNGTDVSLNMPLGNFSTYGKIASINVGASSIKRMSANAIDISTNTEYYTIALLDATLNQMSETYKYTFTDTDRRFDQYYRINYVDHMGATEAFNFDLANENDINISKDIFKNNGTKRIYNTSIEDQYTVTSNWVTPSESLKLKDLWYTPKAGIVTDSSSLYLSGYTYSDASTVYFSQDWTNLYGNPMWLINANTIDCSTIDANLAELSGPIVLQGGTAYMDISINDYLAYDGMQVNFQLVNYITYTPIGESSTGYLASGAVGNYHINCPSTGGTYHLMVTSNYIGTRMPRLHFNWNINENHTTATPVYSAGLHLNTDEIVIKDTSKRIMKRRNRPDLINYNLTFEYADQYNIQRF